MKKLMLGNEAVARGAYEAGVTVASAYPGTPSTEVTEAIATYDDIYSEWAPNEKVATEVAIGASIAGARSICAMKHVGLNVAADPLFTSAYTGVNGGMVIVVADDPGMFSSQNEQDSRYYAKSAHIPMLEPSDSQECKDYLKYAYEISENFDTPVLFRLTTRISHSQSLVELNEKSDYKLKDYVKDAQKYVMMPAMAKKRHVVVVDRDKKLAEFANTTKLNEIQWNNKDIGIITSGMSYQYSKEACPDASILKLGMVHPLPEKLIKEFAAGVKKLYVVEELEPIIEDYIKAMGIEVIGKDVFPIIGEFSVDIVKKGLGLSEVYKAEENELSDINVPARPPVMCPGCPHRGTFYVLKKLKLVVSGDIGCYTLGALSPVESMDASVCMGASIGMAHGMEKARGKEFANKTVAVIGDSTFMHSGITGLIDVIYNRGISTVLILDNSITGMTGHQDNPTTGFTIKGEPTKQVDLYKLCEAVGVDKNRISIVDPFDVKKLEKVVKEEVEADEPSVIIVQRPCALLKKVKYGNSMYIDSEKCRNCKNCLKIACPAILDRVDTVEINSALCVGCDLCTKMCAFGAIERLGDEK